VGKSTLAVSIAGALAPKVALVDADPQATATAWGEAGHLPLPVHALPLTGDNMAAWTEAVLAINAPHVMIDLPSKLATPRPPRSPSATWPWCPSRPRGPTCAPPTGPWP
jgi:hypothetical protein